MEPTHIIRGEGPLILAIPHSGVRAPDSVKQGLNETGQLLADTDWHVDRLYEGLHPNATIVRASFHRYVIDANRDPSGKSLYPGQNTTSLCPTTDFYGAPIYREACEPDDFEIERRRQTFHAPYHDALQAEIRRVHALNGIAIVYDCHSIRSQLPFLFEGVLPDFNIGTNQGVTCAPEFEQAVLQVCKSASDYKTVLNGRFKGGWTTRRYGQPADGVHAIQMELAQATYMDETPPWRYDADKAARLREHLRKILRALHDLAV